MWYASSNGVFCIVTARTLAAQRTTKQRKVDNYDEEEVKEEVKLYRKQNADKETLLSIGILMKHIVSCISRDNFSCVSDAVSLTNRNTHNKINIKIYKNHLKKQIIKQ